LKGFFLSKDHFPFDEFTEEYFHKYQEQFFLLVYNTYVNQLKSFKIESSEMSKVMKEVFGGRPNTDNLKKFFSNNMIQILWSRLYMKSDAFKTIIQMLGDEKYDRAF
jgi:hypothetical protein